MKKIKYYIGTHQINNPRSFLLFLLIVFFGIFGTTYGIRAYPEIFSNEISFEEKENIKPTEPIVINFTTAVFRDKYDSEIKIYPEEKYNLRWENSNKKLVILPKYFWKPNTRYQIELPRGRNIMLLEIPKNIFYFSTEEYPKVLKTFPENEAEDVLIGMEDPIIVDFEKSTAEYLLKFVLDFENEILSQSDYKKTRFKLLPKEELEYSKKYHLKIYARYKLEKEEDYRKIHEIFFETLPPPVILWEKDYQKRLEQAKKYSRAKIKDGKYIDINLEAQIMSIFEEGKIVDAFLISSGKRGMDTPKMETKIYNKFPRAFSKKYGLFMPFWMAIVSDGKFGIHELPEWPGGYKEGTNHLGIPVSHGCVRLGVGSAEKVYNFSEIGTPVIIY